MEKQADRKQILVLNSKSDVRSYNDLGLTQSVLRVTFHSKRDIRLRNCKNLRNRSTDLLAISGVITRVTSTVDVLVKSGLFPGSYVGSIPTEQRSIFKTF